jgi:CRISPR-associated protein Csd1
MILQQLARDAERIVGGEMPPPMYDLKPVKWIIDLDRNGAFLGCIPTVGRETGGKRRDKGKERLVPILSRKRTMKPVPQLLADKISYTLGLPTNDNNAPKQHSTYCTLVESCAARTGNPNVRAVATFLKRWTLDDGAPARWGAEIESNDLITFRVDGRFPVDDADVREFWVGYLAESYEEGAGDASQCLVCGARKPIPERLPVPIQGIPGGQTSGIPLVGVNAEAFESFDLPKARTAGVCSDCAERFGKALNRLLAAEDSHLRVGPLVYVFWTREGAGLPLLDFLNHPDPDAVKRLLTAYRSGTPFTAVDELAFYATALTASGGRAVIRDWLHTTIGGAARNLARWFELVRQVDAYGEPGSPVGVFRLAASLYRDANKELVAQVPRALISTALHGDPLPGWLLPQAVNRCRAEQDVTYPRAALIKAALLSHDPGKEGTMSALDTNERRPGYVCGRLLAVLESIQRQAITGINATLVDRFFGAASTAPASVFGNLLSDAQPHLAKLRKTRPGTHEALQQRMEEVLSLLNEFPRTLPLQEQAYFSLGYYHQRATDRAAARERKAARDAKDTITEEETTDVE